MRYANGVWHFRITRSENVDLHNVRKKYYSNLSIKLARTLTVCIAPAILFETHFNNGEKNLFSFFFSQCHLEIKPTHEILIKIIA